METRIFYTTGNQDIIEDVWDKPDIKDDEIEVKSIFTGVCRSDIDMYAGKFQLLPKTIQGHEGLGVVSKVGKLVRNVKEGDYVATRGEPAFSDYYNCKYHMYVPVPLANPKYILEPVACGINIAKSLSSMVSDQDLELEILILGSGFLATVVYSELFYKGKYFVVGNANKDFWNNRKDVTLISNVAGVDRRFKYVIDLSDKPEYINLDIYDDCAKIVLAAEKHPSVTTTFSNFLWKSAEIKFPSPRNETFYQSMILARQHIDDVGDNFLWTKSYDREIEVKNAFEDGLNRVPGYSRGYIEWKH